CLAYQLVEDMTWRTGQGVSENPLSRNPLVKVGKSITLYDTRIILDYLETICPVPPLMPIGSSEVFEVKTWEALTEGVSGIVIDLHIERIRFSSLQGKEWTNEKHTRVLDGLATAADMLGNRPNTVGDGFTRGDIALAAMLDHLDLQLPGLDWRAAYPNLASWFAEMSKHPAVAVVLKNRQR
ncbi:MAG: glutathione S-transferase C-terminal domain-containing protein, partial [Rhodospirillaceae bacterium]|nr:glutathione S-transferase C-terminal domain-containing protein [Rhodospirillaceae bacterium]